MSDSKITGTSVTIGLAALCADWFAQTGLNAKENHLGGMLQQDYARIVGFLGECSAEVVAPGVITTVDDAWKALEQFHEKQVDAILLVHLMWSEDQPLLCLLEGLGELPLLLWNYHPTGKLPDYLSADDLFRHSGTVGVLQGSAPMQRLHCTPPIIFGSPGDEQLAGVLRQYFDALRIQRALKGAGVGRIAGPCEVMTGTHVDPVAIQRTLGVRFVEISAREYAEACQSVEGSRTADFAADMARRFDIDSVSDASLRLACRNTLALDDLVDRHQLVALAIQDLDPELHALAELRPCLCPPKSSASGVAFGMESDLNTTLGMWIAMLTTGRPCMYTEIFTFDPVDNLLLMGHAGVHDPRLAGSGPVRIVPDAEYRHFDRYEGAWQHFAMAEGPVTCVSLYDTGDGYQMTIFEGESLGGPPRLEGFGHALIRPQVHVNELIYRLVKRGMTQHFVIAPGHISGTLAEWCRLAEITCILEGIL